MFLASLALSMGLSKPVDIVAGGPVLVDREYLEQQHEQARWAELVESASPACKEIASTYAERTVLMQQCGKARAKRRGCSGRINEVQVCRAIRLPHNFCEVFFPALKDLEPVTMTDYMLCEIKVMQGQLEKLQPRSPIDLEKLKEDLEDYLRYKEYRVVPR